VGIDLGSGYVAPCTAAAEQIALWVGNGVVNVRDFTNLPVLLIEMRRRLWCVHTRWLVVGGDIEDPDDDLRDAADSSQYEEPLRPSLRYGAVADAGLVPKCCGGAGPGLCFSRTYDRTGIVWSETLVHRMQVVARGIDPCESLRIRALMDSDAVRRQINVPSVVWGQIVEGSRVVWAVRGLYLQRLNRRCTVPSLDFPASQVRA